MNAAPQSIDAAEAGFVDRLLGLISDHVLTIAALALLGMVVGIASTQGVKMIWPPLTFAPREVADERQLLYTRSAFALGAVWTFGILFGVLTGGMLEKIVLALGISVIAGAGTPFAYDVLRWCWFTAIPTVGQWFLDKFRRNPPPPPPPPAT